VSIPLTFLEPARNLRLAKTITKDGSQPYPLAKIFTSHVTYLSPDEGGLREAFSVMQDHALKGHAVHKGVLKAPIINESRAGKADTNASTNLLVIDLDGYVPKQPLTAPIAAADLRTLVQSVRELLPEPLASTACIGNASASTGFKPNGAVGLHLFFLLDRPVAPTQLSHWLTGLNFSIDEFSTQLTLNRSCISLKYVVDPVVSRNAQIIYIAPPEVSGVDDPFVAPTDRWVLVDGQRWTCDIQELLDATVPALVQQEAEARLLDARKSMGLKKLTPRFRKLEIDGQKVQVLTNPDQMDLTLIRTSDTYAYWNVNGGDSNAYYNPIGNPEIIYNFKGEPPFELKQANEATYNWYCETFKTQIRDTSDPKPLAFREQTSDQHYAVEYNPRDDRVIRVNKIARQNIDDWYASYGIPSPDPIPQWDIGFNPQSTLVIDWDNHKLNLFQPTELLRNPPAILPTYANCSIGEAQARLGQLCPLIYRVLFHICGNGVTEFEWFINWLAYTVQTRQKAQTAWVFSGCPGTGKGIFFERILRPIIGEQYATKKRLDHLEEQFNAYLERTLFLVYEEFRLSDSKQDGKLLNKLKDEIGSTLSNIRAMRTDTVEVPNYTNYIFFSNHLDAVRIEEGDRRFNIAPPQLAPLRAVWPKITQELHMLDDEIGTFAGFLMAYDACENSARTCVENEAKGRMKQLAMGYNERFCLAVRAGQLDYFMDVFDMDIANDLTKSTQITTAQKYVRHWANSIGSGSLRIPVSDLFTVYIAMHDAQRLTQPKFTQMLGRNDVQVERKKCNGSKVSCVDITWVTDLEADDLTELCEPVGHKPAHANFH
jgi:hypothetical protein